MAMLDPKEFWAIYGCGAKVYDATGRLLRHVAACDPVTGEVITYDLPWVAHAWMRLLWLLTKRRTALDWKWGRIFVRPPGGDSLCSRHGFWPAPFTVVPPDDQ